jgi:hypothetical protein
MAVTAVAITAVTAPIVITFRKRLIGMYPFLGWRGQAEQQRPTLAMVLSNQEANSLPGLGRIVGSAPRR